ncbi:MAG: signal peptidase I [Phycisphaerae bacterium]|nr:signal peptidase I [Gemmatimonadaceae bacterium]
MAFRRKSSGKSRVATLRSGKSSGRGARNSRTESAKIIVGTLVVFLLIRTFLLEAFRIPSPSMVPTLLVGDWLFVNKLVYGPHLPGTKMNLPGYADPERGDVVVFRSPPQRQRTDSTPMLVKRCVAVSGDTIFMKNGMLHVNGVEQRQGFAASQNLKSDGSKTHELFRWQKPYELRNSRFGQPAALPTLDNWGPLIVPAGNFFMLGDNRYDSEDSRYWGFVPRRNVRGRPVFVYYSYRADDSDRPLPFLSDIRWGRIGTRIR